MICGNWLPNTCHQPRLLGCTLFYVVMWTVTVCDKYKVTPRLLWMTNVLVTSEILLYEAVVNDDMSKTKQVDTVHIFRWIYAIYYSITLCKRSAVYKCRRQFGRQCITCRHAKLSICNGNSSLYARKNRNIHMVRDQLIWGYIIQTNFTQMKQVWITAGKES